MVGICIYFLRNRMGHRCLRSCRNHYCYAHSRQYQLLQEYLNDYFKDRIYSLNDLYLYLNDLPLDIVKVIVSYLTDHPTLRNYLVQLKLIHPTAYYTKHQLLQRILTHHRKLNHISKHETALRILQQKWLQSSEKGPYLPHNAVNDTDPFTLELITEIDPTLLFSYKDSYNHIYIFRGHEFAHHIDINGPYNPLNRDDLSSYTIYRLRKFIEKSSHLHTFEYVWHTPKEAFLDVLYDYEKFGIYTLLDWFIQLNIAQIINIFILFNGIMTEHQMDLFDIKMLDEALINQHNQDLAQMALALEMKKLIQLDHPKKFYFICSLFIIIATVDKTIGRALPQWVWLGSDISNNE